MENTALAADVERLADSLGQLPEPVAKPAFVAVRGLPGTGKSYFSSKLAERLPLAILESDALRKVLDDTSIATVLNREKTRTASIVTWSAQRVRDFRQRHGIDAFSKKKQQLQGWMTGVQAANSLGISAMSVTRLIQTGVLPAEQPVPGLPAVISREDLKLTDVKEAVKELKTSHNRPLTQDPNQLSLFSTRNS